MASGKKKRFINENNGLCGENDPMDTSKQAYISASTSLTRSPKNEDDMDVEQVEVDFEARNPEDSDFHGIRKLLQQLFVKTNVNLSELTDTLISQNYVGSVIKQAPPDEGEDDQSDDSEDGDEVFGVVSVLNLSNPQKSSAAAGVKKYLLERCAAHCADPGQRAEFTALLQQEGSGPEREVGLLLNERFINIPPQIALPSFQNLMSEMVAACEKRMRYAFTHYVIVAKLQRLAPLAPPLGSSKKKGAARGAAGGGRADWDVVYVNPEEQFFAEEALLQFEYSVRAERDLDSESDDLEPWRRVLLLSKEGLERVMGRLVTELF